jgi:hypothetical protein
MAPDPREYWSGDVVGSTGIEARDRRAAIRRAVRPPESRHVAELTSGTAVVSTWATVP